MRLNFIQWLWLDNHWPGSVQGRTFSEEMRNEIA
jgi:hypothetical protein